VKVFIFIVNYRADTHLMNLLRSIRLSADHTEGIKLELNIYDNSQKTNEQVCNMKNEIASVFEQYSYHSDGMNVGYFGCLPVAQTLVPSDTDVCIYCNPDLELDVSFFQNIRDSMRTPSGMLAPSIIDKSKLIDMNPKYTKRLEFNKMKRLKFIYASPILFALFTYLAIAHEYFISKQGGKLRENSSNDVYAPHGAMFIFYDILFFKNLPKYPCFLFGEEIFIAEEARQKEIEIIYNPKIKVFDNRHASIHQMNRSRVRKLYSQSIRFLIERYYS
jgi:hypothetical protein